MTRVVIVGSGISGCLAALSAKETDPGAEVTLVSTAPGRYRFESGAIGVLGYTPDSDGPVERPLVAYRDLPDDHPYRRLGNDCVRDGLEFFDDLMDDDVLPYVSGRNRNALALTSTGGIQPVSRYPSGFASGLVSNQRPMRIVGLAEATHLDSELVADRLDEAAPYEVESTTIESPLDSQEQPPFEAFARALDENRETEGGVPAREALADVVRPELDVEPRVGFPAMLGREEHDAVRRDLESLLQTEVFEIPVGEPSLPGLRLGDRLFELVEESGIDRLNARISGYETSDDSIQSVVLDGEGIESERFDGDAFVLATGGVAAGGLVGTGDDVVEPVFDCPIAVPDRTIAWTDSDPLGDHPFASFGVAVTETLQPTDTTEEPLYENLLAAGTVLGGHNFVREHSRGGVAIVTGYEAGRRAVERP